MAGAMERWRPDHIRIAVNLAELLPVRCAAIFSKSRAREQLRSRMRILLGKCERKCGVLKGKCECHLDLVALHSLHRARLHRGDQGRDCCAQGHTRSV